VAGAARPCAAPSSFTLITIVGLNIGGLIGGAVIVEQIFALPGVGRLLLGGIFNRDLILVQGTVSFIAVASWSSTSWSTCSTRCSIQGCVMSASAAEPVSAAATAPVTPPVLGARPAARLGGAGGLRGDRADWLGLPDPARRS
jgi:hypothetical protein